jgi:hypothetical protein
LTGLNEAFVIDEATKNRLISEDPKSAEIIKPFLAGRDIKRYSEPKNDKYLLLIPTGWTRSHSGKLDPKTWFKQNYPAIAKYLEPFREKAEKRCDKGEFWWELRSCDYYGEFEKPKIIYPNICKRPEFTFDNYSLYSNQKCFIIPSDDKYMLGILNSNLMMFLFQAFLPKLRGDFYEPSYVYFKDFPIRTIDFTSPADVARHDRMVSLVTSMLELNRKLADARTADEKNTLQRIIDATNNKIDKLVYELYGLTEEEIGIVEGEK